MVLKILLVAGMVSVAAVSPRFGTELMRAFLKQTNRNNVAKTDKNKFRSAFLYLKRRGLINIEYRGRQMYFSLTKEGRRQAGRYKIDDLKIKKEKNWDKKWRILIFDIQDKQKIKREALRGKLKELGLRKLQKSVWVYPYNFKKEMTILRDFFGIEKSEMKIITASEIEDDLCIREYFKLT